LLAAAAAILVVAAGCARQAVQVQPEEARHESYTSFVYGYIASVIKAAARV